MAASRQGFLTIERPLVAEPGQCLRDERTIYTGTGSYQSLAQTPIMRRHDARSMPAGVRSGLPAAPRLIGPAG